MGEQRGGISGELAGAAAAAVHAAMEAGCLPVGGPYGGITLPDPMDGGCCLGSAAMGPQYCTCWEPVHDLEQREVRPGDAAVRPAMCPDCAYKPGSPERSGDERYSGDTEFLTAIVQAGEKFWCHQGMRRVVKLRHPSGAEVIIETDHYDPPKAAGVPYKADGTPGDLCGGWSARRAALLRRERQPS